MENGRSLSKSFDKAYFALRTARKCAHQLGDLAIHPHDKGSLLLLIRSIDEITERVTRLQAKVHGKSLKKFADANIDLPNPLQPA